MLIAKIPKVIVQRDNKILLGVATKLLEECKILKITCS